MALFNQHVMLELAREHADTFTKLKKVEDLLGQQRFHGMDDAIRALVLAAASGEALLFIGPPGTAKSRLIRAFCDLVGIKALGKAGDESYFEYLLTPFTEPSELFGYIDIAKAIRDKDPVIQRMSSGIMLQKAKVVYLDEVFNGSSAILNSILAIMQEKYFHDRGQRVDASWECFFAATNEVPSSPELKAVFDRFVLRCRVENIASDEKQLQQLLSKGWFETYGTLDTATGALNIERAPSLEALLNDLLTFRTALNKKIRERSLTLNKDDPFYSIMSSIVREARANDWSEMSNRRLVKMLYVMLIHALYRIGSSNPAQWRAENVNVTQEDLRLAPKYFLDRGDAREVYQLEKMIADAPRRYA